MADVAEVRLSCGRWYLSVCGIVLAMEGDPCREGSLPEEVYPPISPEELENASIGDKPAAELPMEIVRFFRGERWTKEMLSWVAGEINRKASLREET
jgi:hypothetical protein